MKRILSDQGIQFQNTEWNNIIGEDNIQPILTSIRHPQGNLAERVNKEVGKYLNTYKFTAITNIIWSEYLTFFEQTINDNH